MDNFSLEDIEDNLDEILSSNDEEKIEEFVVEFEIMCNTVFYYDLLNGFFFNFADIFDTLQFFVKHKHTDKVENIINILSKYYKKMLIEKFNTCLANEEYEICEILKNKIN